VRPSLRFLVFAVIGWAGVRAASLGILPGASLFKVTPSAAKTPPIVPTQFPSIEPVVPAPEPTNAQAAPAAYAQPVQPVMVPVYYTAQVSRPAGSIRQPSAQRSFALLPAFDDWSLTRLAGVSAPPSTSMPERHESMPPPPEPPLEHRLDRWQLTTWAFLRSQQTGVAGSRSLATAGQLGASQAGARLFYNLNRQIALTARMSTPVGQRGGEVAAGLRVQPLGSVPVWLTAERRQRVGRFGEGRNAFALFLEGGLYQRPLPWRFALDTYLEGGVVGAKSRDLFVDGGLTVTRPLFRQFSGGIGVWGGAQPGVNRLDAGPRLTMRVRKNMKVHFDWRQKLAGNARPGSGPALTLAGDF
jgi:hypothetical protein